MKSILQHLKLSTLSLGLVLGLSACNQGAKGSRIVNPLSDSTPIMKYKGGQITAKDVGEFVKPKLSSLEEEVLEAYKRGAERALLTRLMEEEAKKQGVSSPDDLMKKIAADASVSDEQVKEFYKANNLSAGVPDPRTGKKRKVTMEEVKGYLNEQEKQQKQHAFLQALLAQAGAQVVLEEPRTEIPMTGNEPFKGGAHAKVVIQEFSDFQCPFCARGRTVVDQISKAYGDKVKIVFRHFPLDFHKEALPSAIAAMCAHKQGKFWEMHDMLFDSQRELSTDKIMEVAQKAGVDKEQFEKCFKNQESLKSVEADMKTAETVGVNSTPTFFVNGRRVAGALPFEQFKSMIDAELAK